MDGESGDLIISRLTAEDVPAAAISLEAELTEMLPFAPIVSLSIELDKRTGYLDCSTHARVLDEILGDATDLPITEHATDTHGVTLVNFGLFDPFGMQLSPRIRDLGRITLYRPGPRGDAEARFPHAGPLHGLVGEVAGSDRTDAPVRAPCR